MTDLNTLVDLPEDEKTNEYDPAVQLLIEAGEGKGYPINVETDKVAVHTRRFAEAARRADKTARIAKKTEDGDKTTVVFKLVPKIVRKTNNESEKPSEGGKVDTGAASA